MKTPEEILEEKFEYLNIIYPDELQLPIIINAMKAYADQQVKNCNTPAVSESVEPVGEGTVCENCKVLLTMAEKMDGKCWLCQQKIKQTGR